MRCFVQKIDGYIATAADMYSIACCRNVLWSLILTFILLTARNLYVIIHMKCHIHYTNTRKRNFDLTVPLVVGK